MVFQAYVFSEDHKTTPVLNCCNVVFCTVPGQFVFRCHSFLLVDQEKWVVNIPKRDLTPVEIAALRKGLNFSITPNKVPVSKIPSSIETGIHNLSQSAKDTIRVSVASTLKTCNLPATVNITREEEIALDDLTKNEEVTIVPADKGRSEVVMENYIAAIQHRRRFMVFRKYISLKDHSDLSPAA